MKQTKKAVAAFLFTSYLCVNALSPADLDLSTLLKKQLTYGLALREGYVKPIVKDLVEANIQDDLIYWAAGPFTLTKKDIAQSLAECLINTIYAYLHGGQAYADQTLKLSAVAEVFYKALSDIAKTTPLHGQLKKETRSLIEKYGGASVAKFFLVFGLYHACEQLRS